MFDESVHCNLLNVKELVPMNGLVLIEKDFNEGKIGSIITTSEERPMTGTVISAPEAYRNEKGEDVTMPVKNGDKVIFHKSAGTTISVNGEKRSLISVKDIFGVITYK